MARAVMVWSPVIMRTSMPASSATRRRASASARSGSMIPTSATSTRSVTAAIGSVLAADIAASSRSRTGEREDPQALLRQLLVGGEELVADVGDRDQLAVPERAAAAVEDDVGCALHGHEVRGVQHAGR